MRSWMLACSAGIILAGYVPVLPEIASLWFYLPTLMFVLVISVISLNLRIRSKLSRNKLLNPLRVVCCAMIGVLWALAHGTQAMHSWLPAELEGVDMWLFGSVDSLPSRSDRAQQFEFKVSRTCLVLHPDHCGETNELPSLSRALLNYYGDSTLQTGQQWRLRVRMNRPHGFANPGGFDYELYLLQRGINAKGYVRDTTFNQHLGNDFLSVQRVRFELREKLNASIGHLRYFGIIQALVIGEREQITTENWELFTRTGTNHLVVISGLHVGFVALVCYWLANAILRFLPALLLRFPAQKLAALAAIFGALAYSLLAGFSLPTQRALIMVAVFMSGRLMARQFPVSFSFSLALLIVLLLAPLSAMSAGFWLSFVAVAALLFAFSGRYHYKHQLPQPRGVGKCLQSMIPKWQVWGQPQWVVFVGLGVPMAIWLQQVSLLSPLANMMAIPVVSLVVVPLCLLGTLVLLLHEAAGGVLLQLASNLLHGLTVVLDWLAGSLQFLGIWQFMQLSTGALIFAALGSLLWLSPRGWRGRYLAPLLFLPLLLPDAPQSPAEGETWVGVLDVGQGLAVVVRTAEHVLVYDTGPRFSDSFDTGSGVVLPFLRSRGIQSVDTLMISHGDNDHAGGAESLLNALPVSRLLVGSLLPIPEQQAIQFPCQRDHQWQWDGVTFSILHPDLGFAGRRNDSSCVLHVQSGNQALLLAGDIETAAEAELVRVAANGLRADVLLAPHHGSNTSSSAAFIQAVDPQVVVFSAGYRNQFGHPAAEVLQRYQAHGTLVLQTAQSGMIEFRLGGQAGIMDLPIPALEYRSGHRRFWRSR